MNPELKKKKACEVLAAMEGGDGPSIVALLTYEARFWPPRSATTRAKLPRPVVGAESIAAVFTRSPHFKTMMWTVEHCLVDGDYVTVHTRMQGKLENGNEYDNWHLWLFCFEDERITDAWEYADTAYAFELMKV